MVFMLEKNPDAYDSVVARSHVIRPGELSPLDYDTMFFGEERPRKLSQVFNDFSHDFYFFHPAPCISFVSF